MGWDGISDETLVRKKDDGMPYLSRCVRGREGDTASRRSVLSCSVLFCPTLLHTRRKRSYKYHEEEQSFIYSLFLSLYFHFHSFPSAFFS